MIGRRAFIRVLSASLLPASLAVRAQTQTRVRRIGSMSTGGGSSEFEGALRQFGWIEGANIEFKRRRGENDALPGWAEELVRLNVDLIVAEGTPAALAAKRATTRIPIVIIVGDPVATGVVDSLARPGGNITGCSIVSPAMTAKRAALLHELLPAVQRVALPHNPDNAISRVIVREAEVAYRSLGMQPLFIKTTSLESFLAESTRQRAQALDLPGLGGADAASFIPAATQRGLPVIGSGRGAVKAGGLLSYGNNEGDTDQCAAAIIDKVLRGARPGDIPIEQPTRFELIVNLKTAKALGITVPQSILLRADDVIR